MPSSSPSRFRLFILAWLLQPLSAFAQDGRELNVGTGSSFTFVDVVNSIITYLAGAISGVAVAMFVVGAFMVTISGVKEDYRQKGKDLMIGAVLSLAVVSGAYAILRTVDYFLTA